MSRTPKGRSNRATLFGTADWLEPISLLAALNEPASTVRTNATKPVVFSRIVAIYDVQTFGARDYAMRIWLDPAKVAADDLTAGDVVAALPAPNVQGSARAL